ncbi:MAG: DUF421 domain-containing protein [Clostridiales bacterium]|nr:DUF421 domain-containing protein [Clostridiales bacterium]
MIVTFLRTAVIFLTLVIVMRLMGKRQIGEMQPFEFIVTLIIADLACIPMADVSIPLIYGISAILTLFILHQLFSLLEQSGSLVKRIISGKPSVVINKDGVDMLELKKNNLGIDDLIESMRSAGYFSLDDVSYAIFESNGKLSTLENPSRESQQKSVPLLIINDGKINSKNVSLIKSDDALVKDFIQKNGCVLKKTEVLTVDGNGRAYLKVKNQSYKILNFELSKGVKW